MLELLCPTTPEWTRVVVSNLDAFLIDHAACERKASATAMSLLVHYPDRKRLVTAMIDLAREELEHFRQVYRHLEARNLSLAPDQRDPYVRALRRHMRHGRETYLLDRLLVAGIIEARGHERFQLIAQALEEGELKEFYFSIAASEQRHHKLFVELAGLYFDPATIKARLGTLLLEEKQIVKGLALRPALH